MTLTTSFLALTILLANGLLLLLFAYALDKLASRIDRLIRLLLIIRQTHTHSDANQHYLSDIAAQWRTIYDRNHQEDHSS